MADVDDNQERLKASLQQALDEARMVLPGVQALFGFQLIAVFNNRFEELGNASQLIHLAALLAVAFTVALIMSPAAYHRQTHPHHVTERLLRVTTRFVSLALVPLTIGLALDLYLVTLMITSSRVAAALAGGMAFVVYGFLWFIFPRLSREAR